MIKPDDVTAAWTRRLQQELADQVRASWIA
jgi:hypothetical protein